MGRTFVPRKDHPPALNYAHLHALADTLWRITDPDDPHAARYSDAAHRLLTGASPRHARPSNWITTLHRYETFFEDHGRAARENTRARHTLTDDERHLGEWARYQRRYEDHLNPYQRARLEVSPAFEWDPRSANWHRNLTSCHLHRLRTGGLPRLNGDDPDEFALARWLGRQLHRLQHGQLDPLRAERLHALLNTRGGSSPW
ncbi:hypothetical protein [Microbacterium sp.]|jgi:hypothetical protein|uniref:hypothetical protein n=1 Tax=Microbacterium sp. TaxID=51671 RepID=UPI002C5774AA|nr:hypothetical protein [Microbacterium sp.]HWL77594.1 hypothetical protein [Microbacterium sp.]